MFAWLDAHEKTDLMSEEFDSRPRDTKLMTRIDWVYNIEQALNTSEVYACGIVGAISRKEVSMERIFLQLYLYRKRIDPYKERQCETINFVSNISHPAKV